MAAFRPKALDPAARGCLIVADVFAANGPILRPGPVPTPARPERTGKDPSGKDRTPQT